ncbi:hypothetical protein KSP39_PZI013494 [Platanthera zijinensis]|uniref:Uncharacterized protein n=1 Tax=Platanthera zijinensis TaxID=2320716 RepID=A0AAP0BCD9_9ASPA
MDYRIVVKVVALFGAVVMVPSQTGPYVIGGVDGATAADFNGGGLLDGGFSEARKLDLPLSMRPMIQSFF